jgi:hypothetical protein
MVTSCSWVAHDGADDLLPVSVALGVVGGVDPRVRLGRDLGERDVAFDAAGAGTAGAAGICSSWAGPIRSRSLWLQLVMPNAPIRSVLGQWATG